MLEPHYHQLDFSDTFQTWWSLWHVFGDNNNNSNNNNTLNQGVTLQFNISCVTSSPSLRWSWRSRQATYSACCFLLWKELNIRPAMLLLQGWEVTLSGLKRVMGATGLSNLNAEQCSYLEKKQEKKKKKYVKSASIAQKARLTNFFYETFYSKCKMQSQHLIMVETCLFVCLFNIICICMYFLPPHLQCHHFY